MVDKISDAMYGEHKKVKAILEEFEGVVNEDVKRGLEILNRFKWNLEKHFFMEEKAIFELCNSSCSVDSTFDLMQEHGDILGLLKIAEEKLEDGEKPNVENIKGLLIRHAEFEDTHFYPDLDESLSDDRKREILERIEDFIQE